LVFLELLKTKFVIRTGCLTFIKLRTECICYRFLEALRSLDACQKKFCFGIIWFLRYDSI
jgi:hypothetical protein